MTTTIPASVDGSAGRCAVQTAFAWLLRLCALLACAFAMHGAAAQTTTLSKDSFDHLRTGFALTGAHTKTRCETCHVNGVFKGTPRDCSSCHLSGQRLARNNVVMPGNHLPTQAACESCHRTETFVGARFNHTGVQPGSCATCHNGSTSSGKPATHIATTASCDSCHRTSGWIPAANFDHANVTPGSCATCHNGSRATGKSAAHVPVAASVACDSCHKSFSGWRPTAWNHTQIAVRAQCASCHTGSFPPADGRPSNHIPYVSVPAAASANCDSCHKGGFGSWANGRFHASFQVSTGCASCHGGGFLNAVSKPNTAVHASVTGNCESCHKSTSSWASAKVDHSTFNASTNCASCHNGSSATGKSATHIPSGSTNCFSCHGTTGWTPSKWNHTQTAVTAQCASCHTGGFAPADGRPSNHIPYQTVAVAASANCDSCHKGSFSTWSNGRFHANFSVTTGCASCHTGSYLNAVAKPNSAIHAGVTGNCESCHTSTTSWSSAKVDHSTFNATTTCANCHNGSTATGKSATHVPVGATNCFSCHTTTGWTPTKWNHTQTTVTAQCASCHTGGFPPADGRPTNHIPYQTVPVSASANCDSCHKGSYSTWSNGRFHGYFSVSTGCASCHNGSYLNAVAKPNTAIHATVTGNCESCHKSTTTWSSAKVDHSTFSAATNCAQCHNGSAATGKSATHIPVGATNCFSCHNTTAWTPTKWNHTQVVVTAQCASCHSGAFPPADGRPSNHVPYQTVPVTATANCDGCHKGSTTTWANGKVHANWSISTGCFSCHTGSYLNATGKPATATHAGVTGNCESCHKSTLSWTSGVTFAHSPANAVGTGTCDTCHNGVTALGKPATHIPVPAGTAKCDSCHRSQTSFATSVTMNHSVVTTATCKSCHNGSYTSEGATGALAKPANHIPEVQLLNGAAMDCNACHTSTTSWSSMRMNHNSSQGNGAGWCKACHQSGTSYLGSMEKKSLTHQKSTGVTDCSQSGCHRPLGTKGSPYTKWD